MPGSPPALPLAPILKAKVPFGHLPLLRRDALALFMKVAEECGDVGRIQIGPIRAHFVSDPNLAEHVLVTDARSYDKGTRGFEKLRLILGRGLVTSEGDFWLRQRRIAQPAFHRRVISGFGETMTAASLDLADEWMDRNGETLDVGAEMTRLTLRIAGETLFSADISEESGVLAGSLNEALDIFQHFTTSIIPSPERLPTRRARRFAAAIDAMDEVVMAMIAERRASGDCGTDLMGLFMAAVDEETGESMTDRQLRDEVLTMLMAGHETTANALSFALMLLSRHPAVTRRLEAELDEVVGDDPPGLEHLPRLVYTKQVLDESLRLYPPAWIIGRRALRETRLGRYRVPAGSFLYLSPYVIHRNPAHWPNPEGFDPERFAPEAVASRKEMGAARLAYLPFGGGQRKCIGDRFAQMEAVLILATLLRRFRLELAPGFRGDLKTSVTLRLRNPLRMTVRRR